MGRKSTKENKSIWQTTREDLGLTREKAGELVPGFSPERIEKIENGRTQIQPEDVILLAEHYRAPSLLNYYCCNECPIGETQVIRADSKERSDEYEDFMKIKGVLDRIAQSVSNLRLWMDEQIAENKFGTAQPPLN